MDLLRQLVADPWLMGRIAANHALSDLYACGARPVSALAAVTLPFARGSLLQRDLQQVLAGALDEFSRVDCVLAGGHSMQGPELQLGFTVNGRLTEAGQLGKRGARPGDLLIVTKPLGTGVLFAAHMQQLADGRDIAAAIDMMLQSNARAAELALAAGATACTDVTGFGLLGHLLEMLGPGLQARLQLQDIPTLCGAREQLAAGVRSTMHQSNAALGLHALGCADIAPGGLDMLFDPQTSGGLLIAVPVNSGEDLLADLRQAGYASAQVIGEFSERPAADAAAVHIS